MWLSRLRLTDFRNYAEACLEPVDGLNVFTGPNGSGKTNLLEAIGVVSQGRSTRQRRNEDLVRSGAPRALLQGRYLGPDGRVTELDYRLDRVEGKRILVDGKAALRTSEVFGLVPVVQCFEEDTWLLDGAPVVRRDFLTCLCSRLYPDFLGRHREFRESLAQRNRLLREGRLAGTLRAAVDEVYVDRAARILNAYDAALGRLEAELNAQRGSFEGEEGIGVARGRLPRSGRDGAAPEWLRSELERTRAEEELRQSTAAGPHRVAFDFTMDGLRAKARASRGQTKNMVLRIKMSEYVLVREATGGAPVILLDDVFAEMDERRRENLGRLLELGSQIFWASTGGNCARLGTSRPGCVFEIASGGILARRELRAAA